jgi:hypothetical protein
LQTFALPLGDASRRDHYTERRRGWATGAASGIISGRAQSFGIKGRLVFGFDLGYWQLLWDIVAAFIAFIGGIVMFFDASMRLNAIVALSLVVVHITTFMLWRCPVVVILYFFYWLLCEHMENRVIPEDKIPRFGLRQATGDPVAEAAKLGLPSIRAHKGKDDDISYADKVSELDKMLAAGDIVGATKYAEAELKAAEAAGERERAEILRKYVLRLQRGKY